MKRGAPSGEIAPAAKRARTGSYGFYNYVFHRIVASAKNGIEFLETWESYEGYEGSYRILGQIEFEDLVLRDESGKSALWLLAHAAANGKPEAFMAVWEQYKDRITLDNLRVRVPGVENLGESEWGDAYWYDIKYKSVLTLLVEASANGHLEELIAILSYFKDVICLKDLSELTRHFRHNIYEICKDGENIYDSRTIFVELAKAAAKGKPEAFISFALTEAPGHLVASNCIRDLYKACNRGYPEPLNMVIRQYPNLIDELMRIILENDSLDEMLNLLNIEPIHNGMIAWLLITIALKGSADQVRQAQQKLNVSNERLLGVLTFLAAKGKPEPFVDFWTAHQDLFTMDDFFIETEECFSRQRLFPFWLLAKVAGEEDNPLPLMLVFEHFKDDIKLKKLFLRPRQGDKDLPPVIWYIAMALHGRETHFFDKLLDNMLSEKFKIIPKGILKKIYYYDGKIKCPRNGYGRDYNLSDLLGEARRKLILAKNPLLRALKKKPTEQAKIMKLYDFAEAAQSAGYLVAFYDLAQYLQHSTEFNPYEAYKRVPMESARYQDTCVAVATYEFSQAILAMSPAVKTQRLRHALKFALKIDKETMRQEYVEKIAYLYVHGKMDMMHPKILTKEVLEKIGIEHDLDWYFEQFDTIKMALPENDRAKGLEEALVRQRNTYMLMMKAGRTTSGSSQKEDGNPGPRATL